MRLRLLANASECYWCHVEISDRLPKNHPQKSTADHLVPLTLGGLDTYDNLIPACFLCNSKRGNKSPAEFVAYLQREAAAKRTGGASVPGPQDGRSRDW